MCLRCLSSVSYGTLSLETNFSSIKNKQEIFSDPSQIKCLMQYPVYSSFLYQIVMSSSFKQLICMWTSCHLVVCKELSIFIQNLCFFTSCLWFHHNLKSYLSWLSMYANLCCPVKTAYLFVVFLGGHKQCFCSHAKTLTKCKKKYIPIYVFV